MFEHYTRFKYCTIQEKYKNHSCIEQHKKENILKVFSLWFTKSFYTLDLLNKKDAMVISTFLFFFYINMYFSMFIFIKYYFCNIIVDGINAGKPSQENNYLANTIWLFSHSF